jgi:hypothetical protein
MLFAMLQEQHDKQIATIAAMNKANMDVMMEQMEVLLAGKGGDRRTVPNQQPTDKKISPPTTPLQNICPSQTCKLS